MVSVPIIVVVAPSEDGVMGSLEGVTGVGGTKRSRPWEITAAAHASAPPSPSPDPRPDAVYAGHTRDPMAHNPVVGINIGSDGLRSTDPAGRVAPFLGASPGLRGRCCSAWSGASAFAVRQSGPP